LTCIVEAAISGLTEIKFAVEEKAVVEKGGRTDNYCRPIKSRLVAASAMWFDFYEKSAIFRYLYWLYVRFPRFLLLASRACSSIFSLFLFLDFILDTISVFPLRSSQIKIRYSSHR